ncbi:MAG: DegV family protein [Bacillota bacterium]|nr:DegV family protein [Bacillota bacterium]MDD4263404.1 DegV family protein [Bacillota bacterium]
MSKTVIVIDSTADLPKSIREELDLHIVPLNVHFGTEVFRDQVDLNSQSFYAKLKENKSMIPRTSQPSPAQFVDVYKQVASSDDQIISFHISNKASGTIQSALIAKSLLPEYNIEVIDSEGLSIHYGMQVIEMAKKAREGASVEEILKHRELVKKNIQVCFTVETLEYLHKNGRIGSASAFLGTVLSIKPILSIENGMVSGIEKIRGRKRALKRLVEYIVEKTADSTGENLYLGIVQGDAMEEADALEAELRKVFPKVGSILRADMGPIIGAHAGPGTVGIVAYKI